MKRLLSLVAFFATLQASAQQVNPVPDYVFRNQMSVGRGTVTDTAAYFSIGPRYGANKGFMPPIVGDTATFSSGKRNGLLIFSVQKNKFLYWDSVRVQWSDMAGSSGTYITGSGILGYVPQFSGTTTIDTSALFTIGNRLGIGTTSFAYNTTSTANVELNGTAGGIVGFKRNDSARGYLWHTGSDMELANTTAGTLSFNTNSATRGSISSAGVWRLHNLAGTGDRVVVASSNGTLSASTSVTGLVDTLTLSTRAWRQKGLDSLAALEVSGSGTTNYVPKFTAASTIGNSIIFDNATNVGIGTASPSARLHIVGEELRIQNNNSQIGFRNGAGTRTAYIQSRADEMDIWNDQNTNIAFGTNNAYRMTIFANGRVGVNTRTDAGYQFDINGTLRSVNGANFATSSGNVGIGTASPNAKLDVQDALVSDYASIVRLRNSNAGTTNTNLAIEFWDRSTSINAAVIGTRSNIAGNWGGDIVFKNQQNGSPQTATTSLTEVMKLDGANQRISLSPAGTELFRFASTGELLINTTSDAGDYKLQVAGNIYASGLAKIGDVLTNTNAPFVTGGNIYTNGQSLAVGTQSANFFGFFTNNTQRAYISSAGEFIIDASASDAGDYKLQVVGNARIGTGKLDIASNTTFGLGIARSGTSEVAGQIYNSNGILYFGAESSAGGQIFTGSSAYAAVIGSGANYPLQFAVNNATYATLNTNGRLLINTKYDNGAYPLQVAGSVYNTGQVTRGVVSVQGTNAQVFVDSTTNLSPFAAFQTLSGSNVSPLLSGNVTWNTTGNANAIDIYVTNTASGVNSNFMQLGDGTNNFKVTKDASIVTANPTGGTARKWRLGSAATVSPTSPNRTIQIEVDGVVYYLHAKTTND